MNTLITILIALLSAFFIFAGSIKVFGWQKMIFETQKAFMVKYGLNRQILGLIGAVELFAAVIIWFQTSILGFTGALIILVTSIGALYFHAKYDPWSAAVPAMVTGSISLVVAIAERGQLVAFIETYIV